MRKNNSIIAFILGILTIIFIIPVFSGLGELICQWIEAGKTIPIEKTSKRNINITKLQNELEKEMTPSCSQAIGFEIPSEDCDVCGDYCRNKIGFR